jgi:type 1 fimbriae regulatory protein FimE
MKKRLTPPRRQVNAAYRDEEHLEHDVVKSIWLAAGKVGRHRSRDSAMIRLAFHHGLRSSETCRLKWERIFLDKLEPELWISRRKGSNSGRHPLFDDDVIALRKLQPEPKGWVFKSESKVDPGPVSESGFQKIVRRAGELASIMYPVHPHMLRHSCGFWLRARGYDIQDIRDWLGHVSITSTEIYAKAGPDRFRDIGIVPRD